MRKFIIIIAVALSILFTACNKGGGKIKVRPNPEAVYVLVDNTDSSGSRMDLVPSEKITKLVGGTGEITFRAINGTNSNSIEKAWIHTPYPLDSVTPLVLETDYIDKNAEKIEYLREKFLGSNPKGSTNSSIVKPLWEALITLQKSKYPHKTVLIISDMIENSQYGDFYHQRDVKLIQKRLDSIGIQLPENFKGLKVIVLFNANGDVKKDRNHDRVMEIFWRPWFKNHGIILEEKTNL